MGRREKISCFKRTLLVVGLGSCLTGILVGQPFETDISTINGIQTYFVNEAGRAEVQRRQDFQTIFLDLDKKTDPIAFGADSILADEFSGLVDVLGIRPSNHAFGLHRETRVTTDSSGSVITRRYTEGALSAESTLQPNGEETRVDYAYTSTGDVNRADSTYFVLRNGKLLTTARCKYRTENTYQNELLEKTAVFWEDKLSMQIVWNYDKATQRLLKVLSFSPTGSLLASQKYEYDSTGKLFRREHVDSSAGTTIRYTYESSSVSTIEFESDGQKKETYRLQWSSDSQFRIQKDGDSLFANVELNEYRFVKKATFHHGTQIIGTIEVSFD